MLRLYSGFSPKPNAYVTNWFKVITANKEETLKSLHFGFGWFKTKTPKIVQQKLAYYKDDPQGQKEVEACRGVEASWWPSAAEYLLTKSLPLSPRFYAQFYLYDYRASFKGGRGDLEELRGKLEHFFEAQDFRPKRNAQGEWILEVKPHLILRHLNSAGEVTFWREFLPKEAQGYTKSLADYPSFLNPKQCARQVLEKLKPCDHWDLLPGKIFNCDLKSMRLGDPKNHHTLKQMWLMQLKDLVYNDPLFTQPLSRNMGKLSQGKVYLKDHVFK